ELTIESWAEGLSGKLVFVPWKHIDPDGKNAANRLGDFQDHLERVPKPPKPAGPGQGLPPADVDQLVRIMSAAAQNYPGRAPSYFSNLLLKARLPEQFRPEVAGVGQGAPDADARFLIAWAQGKGTAPGTDPPRYTLVLILEALSASLGTEDRSFIVEAIRRIG
ncbi:MAG TPA: hypothetical protein VD866_21330, partial [Urbifossiella sp.]|nr:hypothetical protein [Urbifossiella sp.]